MKFIKIICIVIVTVFLFSLAFIPANAAENCNDVGIIFNYLELAEAVPVVAVLEEAVPAVVAVLLYRITLQVAMIRPSDLFYLLYYSPFFFSELQLFFALGL